MMLENETEKPDWVWVLTIQHLHDGEDDEDFEEEFGGEIAGCYATKEHMIADMQKLGNHRYGMFHLKVDGWKPNLTK